MNQRTTAYGQLIVGSKEELFQKAVSIAAEQQSAKAPGGRFTWALTGGSTPAEWYRWCVTQRAIPQAVLDAAVFTVSDERTVPLASDQSNFGNADRQLLTPLSVGAGQKRPWPVELSPADAAAKYGDAWANEFGAGAAFDVCFLGMGDDAHTASIFPGSALLEAKAQRTFEAIEVPGKGWRLTITPEGLRACGRIVVMTLGAGKADALARVFTGAYNPATAPSQILKTCAERVIWLVDAAAAAKL
jgi:6-phosphogluconolactonase